MFFDYTKNKIIIKKYYELYKIDSSKTSSAANPDGLYYILLSVKYYIKM